MLKLGWMQREQEMPLKNKNWQTDEVAEECKCDTTFPAFDKRTRNSETEVVHRPLVHSINIHHLSTESMDNLLWMINDIHTGG